MNFIAAGKNTRSHHLQFADDLLLTVNALGPDGGRCVRRARKTTYYQTSLIDSIKTEHEFNSGLRIYDVSKPTQPREVSFPQHSRPGAEPAVVCRRDVTPTFPRISMAGPMIVWRSSISRTSASRRWLAAGGCRACGGLGGEGEAELAGQSAGWRCII